MAMSAFVETLDRRLDAGPAPTMPTPGSLWAMPVLICGRMPVSTTLRTSMPGGVPRKFEGRDREVVVLAKRDLVHLERGLSAICGVPPTNWTMAGAAAMAKPP